MQYNKSIRAKQNYINLCKRVVHYLRLNKDVLNNVLLRKTYLYLRSQDPYKHLEGDDLGNLTTCNAPYKMLCISKDKRLVLRTVYPYLYSDTVKHKPATMRTFTFVLSHTINRMVTYLGLEKMDYRQTVGSARKSQKDTNMRIAKMKQRHTDFDTIVKNTNSA